MKQINCSCCNTALIVVPENEGNGYIAVHLQLAGYIAKCSVLYTGTAEWYWYCSKECHRKHYASVLEMVPVERIQKVNQVIGELRDEIPEMVAETCETLDKFQKAIFAVKAGTS